MAQSISRSRIYCCRRLATLLPCLLLLAGSSTAGAAAQLALSRPDGDCLAPALTTLATTYNFFPSSYQLQSIPGPSASSTGLSTTVEFASDFTVTYYGTYKVVKNTRADEAYLLYQCGTPNPQAANTELDLPPNTKVFEVPLVSVAVTDSNAAAFLAELGLVDRVAFASQYSVNPCLQAINACGGNAIAASNDSSVEWEQLAAAQQPKVDAILTGSKTANPKSIAITSFADPGVLNRAEWVKFLAVFFNKEVEANNLFDAVIVPTYTALNRSARAVAAAPPPKAAWVSKYGDALTLSYAPYKLQYLTDAGAQLPATSAVTAAGGVASPPGAGATSYVFNASLPAQRRGFFTILQDVDIIFDESYAPDSSNLLDMAAFRATYGPGADNLPAVANGRVYVFNNRLAKSADGTVGSDWFETSVARPDLVLRDFVKVITPSAVPANTTLTWLRQLPATNVTASNGRTFITAASCDAIKSGANAANRCSRTEPARICPNAYRDCATGELKTVTDPAQRCSVRTVCPDPNPVGSSSSSSQATAKKSAAAAPAAGGMAMVAAAAAALAVLLL